MIRLLSFFLPDFVRKPYACWYVNNPVSIREEKSNNKDYHDLRFDLRKKLKVEGVLD